MQHNAAHAGIHGARVVLVQEFIWLHVQIHVYVFIQECRNLSSQKSLEFIGCISCNILNQLQVTLSAPDNHIYLH